MEILESLEVRWFLAPEAAALPVLKKWFACVPGESGRADHYLLTGRRDLSLKARLVEDKPAKVEMKWLAGSLGVIDLVPGMTGELQRWTKFSLTVADPQSKQHGVWLEVAKARQLRKFAVSVPPDFSVKEEPATAKVPAGCGAELTQLDWPTRNPERAAWTFGLEAFGPTMQLLDVLKATVESIAATARLPSLPAAWTLSYPDWLLSCSP